MSKLNYKKAALFLLASVLGLILWQIKFNDVVGTNASFTLFDFYAPALGALLGGPLAIASVFITTLTNFLVTGAEFNTATIIRLFPTLFAVYYFSLSPKQKEKPAIIAVPLFSMLAFCIHPIGRTVWFYSLFWLIPVAAYFRRDITLLRSLGATFTAHAVGGAAFIWALNLPAQVWIGLIPVVIVERSLFSLGISVSYKLLNKVLYKLSTKYSILTQLNFETK